VTLEVIIALMGFFAYLKIGKPGSNKLLKSAAFLEQGAGGASPECKVQPDPLKCFALLSLPFSLSFGIVSEHTDNF